MKFRVHDKDAHTFLLKAEGATRKGIPFVANRVAVWSFGQLVRQTPKKWTGQTRRSWQLHPVPGGYQLTNLSKVMNFLEVGTRAHGPKKAKALFIPLTRRAALGTTRNLVYGKDYILVKWVRGIRARWIVARQREKTRDELYRQMRAYITNVINK